MISLSAWIFIPLFDHGCCTHLGREVVVVGRGSIVPDVIKTTRNLTAESETQQLRLFLYKSIEYKVESTVAISLVDNSH